MIIKKKTPADQLFIAFCEAYKKRDLEKILSLFSKDIQMWGSGADEYRFGLSEVEEQIRRDWAQSEKGEIEVLSFVPNESGHWSAAICNAKITINGVEYLFEQLRGTIIIKNESGQWKINHMHASFPNYRNPPQSSFPTQTF